MGSDGGLLDGLDGGGKGGAEIDGPLAFCVTCCSGAGLMGIEFAFFVVDMNDCGKGGAGAVGGGGGGALLGRFVELLGLCPGAGGLRL